MIQVTARLAIPEDAIEEQFIRASGPGGQNVNKVATAVQLRFYPARAPELDAALVARLGRLAGQRLNDAGEIVITARRHRTREANRRDALERLLDLIRRAAVPPTPRRATRPTRASQVRRVDAKTRRAGIKRARRAPTPAD